MTDEKMLELARQAGIGGRPVGAGDGDTYVAQPATPTQLRKFAALVRREALEDAEKSCRAVRWSEGDYDDFDEGVEQCVFAIRALAAQEADK